MNQRLDTPPGIDVSVSQHMGLFAVSRLAARHGVKVRLRAASPEGVSALIWLPDSLAGRHAARHAAPWPRRPASQATAAQLSVGGRRVPGRRSFVLVADHQEDDSTDGELASGPMTAAAPAAARSIWFRANRPSSASARAALTGAVIDPAGRVPVRVRRAMPRAPPASPGPTAGRPPRRSARRGQVTRRRQACRAGYRGRTCSQARRPARHRKPRDPSERRRPGRGNKAAAPQRQHGYGRGRCPRAHHSRHGAASAGSSSATAGPRA